MKAQLLIDYLLQFGTLNGQQIDLILQNVSSRTYSRDTYFLRAGQVSREIGFITEGIFRVCYYDQEGNEITRYFLDEKNFIADINSYNSGLPTSEYVQAVTPCEVLIFSRQAMETLSQTIIIWDSIISKITAKAFAEKVSRVSAMMPLDAKDRYEYFLDKFPDMANRIELQYIASYIGVTKSSLSRLRRSFGKK